MSVINHVHLSRFTGSTPIADPFSTDQKYSQGAVVDDPVIWIIIIAFYAPLHFMLPVLFLFIVGHETEAVRTQLIRSALIDAALSMAVAFALAVMLVNYDQIALAMVILMLFMLVPFVRIIWNRRTLK
jgi:uncharacterized membrane protein YesL